MTRTTLAALALSLLTSITGCAADADAIGEGTDDVKKAQELNAGETAHFKAFDVTVTGVKHDIFEGAIFEGIQVKVCAKTDNPVSWSPWSLVTTKGDLSDTPSDPQATPWKPKDLYPQRADLRAGRCAEGIVPINTKNGETFGVVRYKNSLGEHATWKVKKAFKLAVGQTAKFDRFDVTLRGFEQKTGAEAFYTALDVKVCAKGESGPVTWEPWALGSFFGDMRMNVAEDEKIPFPKNRLYPRNAELKAGECAEGLVVIDQVDGETIVAFVYENSLGDRAIWQ